MINMAKGLRKRRNHLFQDGNSQYLKRRYRPPIEDNASSTEICTRIPKSLYEEIVSNVNGNPVIADSVGAESNTRLLRPGPSEATICEKFASAKSSEMDTYRVLHLGKTAGLFRETYEDHAKAFPFCKGNITWDLSRETKWGLCWGEALMCKLCGFQGKKAKLYEEVETKGRGRKAAKPNVGLQVGLSNSSIASTGFCDILMHTNIPIPSTSGMQKTANQVDAAIEKVNKTSLASIREDLKIINHFKGRPKDTPVKMEGDCRYTNSLHSGAGKTLFQPATQCTYTLCENETKKKRIIAVSNFSKLCGKSSVLTATTDCDHPGVCSQNIKRNACIGNEGKYAKETYEECLESNLRCSHVTTDGDAQAFKGMVQVNEDSTICNLSCSRHLSQTQKRMIERQVFSKEMFNTTTQKEKEKLQKRFARELSVRCSGEFAAALKKYGPDTNKLVRSLSFAADAILDCYGGSCGQCMKYSFVCMGKGQRGYLPGNNNVFMMTEEDKQKIRNCMDLRFSRNAVEATKYGTNTQKCEAVNRAYLKAIPKFTTFTRNYSGRVHSTVHSLNHGISSSAIKKCESVGAQLSSGTRLAKQMSKREQRKSYLAKYKQSSFAKRQRATYRKKWYELYDKKQDDNEHYSKKEGDKTVIKRFCEHSYSKNK